MKYGSRHGFDVGGAALAALLFALPSLQQVAFAQAPPTETTAPATAQPVKFVSYNLKNYLNMDRRVGGEFREDAPKPEPEIAKMVEFLVTIDPDIIGICEIGVEADLIDLQARLKTSGLDLPHREWVDGADSVRHVAALSRFPFVARDHQTDLGYLLNSKEFKFNRGILDATVQLAPDYKLRLLGIHLKSKREVRDGDQALMRRNEAQLLRNHVEKILEADANENVVMYGDFNDTRNETPIKVLQGKYNSAKYMRDIQVADKNGFRWTYYWSWADIYSRFDFAFVSRGLYPEIVQEQSYIFAHPDWFTASDHRPVVLAISPKDAEKGSVRE
ncbi:MAG: endonuclease/exonuclease/phosphatase family metal-dependent hydrolase [Verrucomicrobiales bacterium]|jgi:endonuclease/exonuclease/phosphatase family metal-dependent hydrolase